MGNEAGHFTIDPEDAEFEVGPASKNIRLDVALARRFPEISRGVLQNAISEGAVSVNGRSVKPSCKLATGDKVILRPDWFEPQPLEPQAAPFEILYEDAEILVIVKPAGLTVHPSAGCPDHTLANALLAYAPEVFSALDDGTHRPGIVHRLDRDTSGVMVIAKTIQAMQNLKAQFKSHDTQKTYWAILEGHLPQEAGTLETLMGKDPHRWDRRAVLPDNAENGKLAVTRFSVLAENDTHTLVKVKILTGRTHQIRVHMAYLGAPVAGDKIYGGHTPPARQMLHAGILEFRHPTTGEPMFFKAPFPDDFRLELLGLASAVVE